MSKVGAVASVRNLLWRARRKFGYWRLVTRAVASPRPPVIVYQMAKVASTTVVEAVNRVDGYQAFQVHLMDPDHIRRVHSAMRRRGLEGAEMDTDILGRALYRGVVKAGRVAKVITLVREPIGRNISFYFQTLDVLWKTANAHSDVAGQAD